MTRQKNLVTENYTWSKITPNMFGAKHKVILMANVALHEATVKNSLKMVQVCCLDSSPCLLKS